MEPIDTSMQQAALDPVREVTLSHAGQAVDFAVTHDGRVAYVLEHRLAVDVWAALMRAWPWIGAGILLVVLIVLGVKWWRVWRRANATAGEPFCKGCGYQLTGVKAADCPECGKAIGEGDLTRRPTMPVARVMLWCIGVYLATVLVVILPGVRHAVTWRSMGVMDYLLSKRVGVLQHFPWRVVESVRLHRVDMTGAEPVREVVRGDWSQVYRVSLSEDDRTARLFGTSDLVHELRLDGTQAVTAVDAKQSRWLIDLEDAEALARTAEPYVSLLPLSSHMSAFSSDGRYLCDIHLTSPAVINLWDMQAGRWTTTLNVPGGLVRAVWVSEDGGRAYVLAEDSRGGSRVLVYELGDGGTR